MVKTWTNAIHIVAFVNQPLATPHQAFLPIGSEVPLAKKSSFPPGEAKRRLREPIPFNVPIHSGNGGWLRVPIIYKLFTHAIVLRHFHDDCTNCKCVNTPIIEYARPGSPILLTMCSSLFNSCNWREPHSTTEIRKSAQFRAAGK